MNRKKFPNKPQAISIYLTSSANNILFRFLHGMKLFRKTVVTFHDYLELRGNKKIFSQMSMSIKSKNKFIMYRLSHFKTWNCISILFIPVGCLINSVLYFKAFHNEKNQDSSQFNFHCDKLKFCFHFAQVCHLLNIKHFAIEN